MARVADGSTSSRRFKVGSRRALITGPNGSVALDAVHQPALQERDPLPRLSDLQRTRSSKTSESPAIGSTTMNVPAHQHQAIASHGTPHPTGLPMSLRGVEYRGESNVTTREILRRGNEKRRTFAIPCAYETAFLSLSHSSCQVKILATVIELAIRPPRHESASATLQAHSGPPLHRVQPPQEPHWLRNPDWR